MHEIFHRFFEFYEKGEIYSAIKQILPNLNSSYDSLPSNEPLITHLVNFIDACVFGHLGEALIALRIFREFLEQDKNFKKTYPKSYELLKYEEKVLLNSTFDARKLAESSDFTPHLHHYLMSYRQNIPLKRDEIHELLHEVPSNFKQTLESQISMSQGWLAFNKEKPTLAALISKNEFYMRHPWYPIRFPMRRQSDLQSISGIPLIYLEPLQQDFSSFLNPLKNRPALFVFDFCSTFYHMLQYPEVVESLCNPAHLIYILEIYPNEQFQIQFKEKHDKPSFQPFLFTEKKQIKSVLPTFMEALSACYEQALGDLRSDTECANWLYRISKRILFSIQEERLGINRTAALLEKLASEAWEDSHKKMAPEGKDLGPEPSDYMKEKLLQLKQARLSKQKIRIAHIVPQIVDIGHAPSRLLEYLVVNADRDLFEIEIICTEKMQFHFFEYPYNFFTSEPSIKRAANRIRLFQSLGINIHLLSPKLTYEQAAVQIAQILDRFHTDVAVFHGPNVINTMSAQITNAHLKVLFEHGTPPTYPGFDVAIISTFADPDVYRKAMDRIHTKVVQLPFCIDVTSDWTAQPPSTQLLGIPSDSLIMTTISNHLDTRLSQEMCQAIAEILTRVPNAFYAPIGRILNPNKFYDFFKEHGVGSRIKFLGPLINPSNYTRCMHLYLNEFPFGSCLGMLDAMASGCPVVTMYDTKGPQQARYGGDYFGIDKAVVSGKKSDYVDLACNLLTDKKLYKQWSEHAKKQYAKHSDVKLYVKDFEKIIIESLKNHYVS